MSTPEDRLTAVLDRFADRVAVAPDAWAENRRRLAARRRSVGPRWVMPAIAAAVVAVTATVSVVSGADRTSVAGPAVDLGDRHFADPALENCVQQIRAGDGHIAQIQGVDPAASPIVFRLADDELCTISSAGGELIDPGHGVSEEVPYLSVTGGDDWTVVTGAVTSAVDRITFTPDGASLATVTGVPTESLGSLRAFAIRTPGAGTVRFLSGETVVAQSGVGPLTFDPSSTESAGGPGPSSASGADLLVPVDQRVVVGSVSGSDVATGSALVLDSARGQVVVLPVWASWCGPCREQQPALNDVAAALPAVGAQIMGLDVSDDPDVAAAYIRELGVRYPSLVTTMENAAAAVPGVPHSSIPVTVLIDREHRVAQVFSTIDDADQVVSAATALAAE